MRDARWGWLLAAAAAVYALVNVIVFYATGTFGPDWLAMSLIVYGTIVLAAIALAIVDRGQPAPAEGTVGATHGEPTLIERAVTYRTVDGMAVKLAYLWPDGARETQHITFTPGESLSLHEIETRLDAFPAGGSSIDDLDAQVEAALRARSWTGPPPSTEEGP